MLVSGNEHLISFPSPPPTADIRYLSEIWFMQLAKASIRHLYPFPSGELETKQSAWRSAPCFLVLGCRMASCLHSTTAVGKTRDWDLFKGPVEIRFLVEIQPVMRCWMSVCRALDRQQEMRWRTLVFSLRELSTGACTNWPPLLTASAVQPKILSYAVSQSLEWIHTVVARWYVETVS